MHAAKSLKYGGERRSKGYECFKKQDVQIRRFYEVYIKALSFVQRPRRNQRIGIVNMLVFLYIDGAFLPARLLLFIQNLTKSYTSSITLKRLSKGYLTHVTPTCKPT